MRNNRNRIIIIEVLLQMRMRCVAATVARSAVEKRKDKKNLINNFQKDERHI